MSTEDSIVTGLHQRASEFYLQGEFEKALATWRELLKRAPSDERALEGVRLCEMLADDTSSTPLVETPAEPGSEAQIEPSFARDLPDPSIQGDGIDLGDVGHIEPLPLAGAAPAAPAAQAPAAQAPQITPTPQPQVPAETADAVDDALSFEFDLPDDPEVDAPQAPAAPASAQPVGAVDPAILQLQERVNELYREALSHHENGDDEQAVSVLCRLFILDEGHAEAQALQEKIRQQLDTGAVLRTETPPPLPAVSGTLDLDDEELNEAVPAASAASAAPAAPAETAEEEILLAIEPTPAGPETVAEADSLPLATSAMDEPDLFDVDGDPPAAPVAAPSRSMPRWPLVVGAALILAVAGFFGYKLFFGGSAGSAEAEGQTQAAGIASLRELAGEEGSAPVSEEGTAPEAPAEAEEPVVDIDTLLGRAREAFAAEDYAAAVVAYNEVIRRDPANTEAEDQLIAAGEKYREQQAKSEQWEHAIMMYNGGNYRAALHDFYRIEDGDQERLTRYKRNGWYNLGLQALHYGDCRTAQEHLKEGVEVAPDDEGLAAALALASECRATSYTPEVKRVAERMSLRALDD